jgi:surface protein
MGIFDFLKSNKNIITDNGTNYIYFDNGKGSIKEKFSKINGVLNGEYFKYEVSGEILSTDYYHDGHIITLDEKQRMKLDNITIREAVNLWCENQNTCIESFGHISNWDTSHVTDMSKLFKEKRNFNENIGSWNVSKVTNMSYMFCGAEEFDQEIGSWNVSKVTNMSYMFNGAEDFDQEIGSWNVSKVTNMSFMFSSAIYFNQNIGAWNVSSVKLMDWMFFNATSFNQNIGSWNVSKVTDMSYMFSGATAFNPRNIRDYNPWKYSKENVENQNSSEISWLQTNESIYHDDGNTELQTDTLYTDDSLTVFLNTESTKNANSIVESLINLNGGFSNFKKELRNGYELFYVGNKFSISWRYSLVGLIQVDIISRDSNNFDEFNTMNIDYDDYYYNIAKSNFLNDEAYLYFDISDFKEGINSVTLALNIIPDDSGFLDTLALGYYYLENYELAIESSNRCIELDNINNSQNPEHFTTRAKINIKLNNLENAIEDLKIAIELDPDFEEAIQLLETLK